MRLTAAERKRAIAREKAQDTIERNAKKRAKARKRFFRNWNDLVPPQVAMSQGKWDKATFAKRAYDCGLTVQQIADLLHISKQYASILVRGGEMQQAKNRISPVELYMRQKSYLVDITNKLARIERKKKRVQMKPTVDSLKSRDWIIPNA